MGPQRPARPFVGAATYMLNRCVDYAKNREQFGRKIGQFQAIKQKIADIRIFGEAARNLVYGSPGVKTRENHESPGSCRSQTFCG